MKNKKLLVISYFYAPRNVVGAIRPTKLTKYIEKNGCDIEVITSLNSDNIKDELLEKDTSSIKIINIEHSKLYQKAENLILNRYMNKQNNIVKKDASKKIDISKKTSNRLSLKEYLKIIINFILTVWQGYDFTNRAKKEIKKTMKINNYKNVYCTYGPFPSLILVKWMMKKYKKINYIVDFRDPVTINGSKKIKILTRYFNNLVKYIITRSNYVIGVTEGITNYLKNIVNRKVLTIYNGYDVEDIVDISKTKKDNQNKIVFSYAGGLYRGKRDLTILFKVLRKLIEESIISTKQLEIAYAGKEINELLYQASLYNLENIISYKGFLSRSESLKLQANSDISVVVTWNYKDDLGVIPGKLSEAMLFYKPILAIVNGEVEKSEIYKIINKYKLGFCYESSNQKSYYELYKFLKEYIETKSFSKLDTKEFDYKNIALQYFNFLR